MGTTIYLSKATSTAFDERGARGGTITSLDTGYVISYLPDDEQGTDLGASIARLH